MVPSPSATAGYPDPDSLISFAASCYNSAFEMGMNEYSEKGKIFSPQNWLKSKDSLTKLKAAAQMLISVIGRREWLGDQTGLARLAIHEIR